MSYVIGLTGGIGSGKTVASDHFARLGVPVIDTDVIARQVVQPGEPTLDKLAKAFGKQIITHKGELDRAALRKIAFSSVENKTTLDSITHPAIRVETRSQISLANYPYCIVVVPLLTAESEFAENMDRILVVTAERETKIERVIKRSNLAREEVERIMQSQLSDEQRLLFADDVIGNDGTIEDAQKQVEKLHELYLELSSN